MIVAVHIECVSCGATGPVAIDADNAASEWNTRSDQKELAL